MVNPDELPPRPVAAPEEHDEHYHPHDDHAEHEGGDPGAGDEAVDGTDGTDEAGAGPREEQGEEQGDKA